MNRDDIRLQSLTTFRFQHHIVRYLRGKGCWFIILHYYRRLKCIIMKDLFIIKWDDDHNLLLIAGKPRFLAMPSPSSGSAL